MLAGLVLSAGIAFATPQPGEVATQLVREACVGTGMQKDAFERLGQERRWRPAPLATPLAEPGAWFAGFETSDALITLSSTPNRPDTPGVHTVACTVMSSDIGDGWLTAVEVLVAEMGLDVVDVVSALPPAEEVHVWSDGPGGQTLMVTYIPERRRLSIAYMTREPALAS